MNLILQSFPLRSLRRLQSVIAIVASALLLATVGCHHDHQTAYAPPPPPLEPQSSHYQPHTPLPTPIPDLQASAGFDDISGRPVFVETGIASWYGPKYNRQRAADGTTYDQDGMTAAHRTLPLGSTARVTNLSTGQQVLVRITDLGPFAPGRVLDLSLGAAKAIGIYRVGTAQVRVEAFAHVSADPAGKWCVQTGAFLEEQDALDLKEALIHRYSGAKVAEFQGPTGFWVRIDPADHSRTQAVAMLDWIGKPAPQSLPYLVRID
jgi:rare lipoprotein A